MVLAIDFDGTIHDINNPVAGHRMGPPMPGALEKLSSFRQKGYKIIIHKWMEFYDIPYDEITNIKPVADYYIDDKAIKFTSWSDIIL